MRVIRDIGRHPVGVDATALTIGAYDGVHLGHRVLLGEVRRRAAELGIESAVVTFDRHPAEVVRPESAPRLLVDLDQKLELLESTGIDLTVVIHFDEVRAEESATDFVREVLVDALGARVVAVGEDFHFGHHRQGNVALLEELGAVYGFEVLGHHLVGPDGTPALDEASVSSTAIRRALVEGRLDDANRMLGRPHEMRGPVVDGDHRGREIGFPTANVAISSRMLYPADGIYAGRLRRADGEELAAAIYVGHRPTFYDDGAAVVLEVHCLDWDGDLYGEQVAVTFLERLRGDQEFGSVEELQEQLAVDCAAAAERLARA
jgi:riboflavin kinase/FMN adenylyltransferase